MNPEALRADGDWLKQLKKILGVQQNVGTRPDNKSRSTKTAVNELFTNLKGGVKKTALDASDEDHIDKVIFNAVELLVKDKEQTTSNQNNTRRNILERFQAEIIKQSGDFKSLDDSWKKKINQTMKSLIAEENGKDAANALFAQLANLPKNGNPDTPIYAAIAKRVDDETHAATEQYDLDTLKSFESAIKAKGGVDNKLKQRAEELVKSAIGVRSLMGESNTLDAFDVKGSIERSLAQFGGASKLESLQNCQVAMLKVTDAKHLLEPVEALIREEESKLAANQLSKVDVSNKKKAKAAILKKATELAPNASTLEALQSFIGALAKQGGGLDKLAQELIDEERKRMKDEEDRLAGESLGGVLKGVPKTGTDDSKFDYKTLVSNAIAELKKENDNSKTGKQPFEILARFSAELQAKSKKSGAVDDNAKKKLEDAIQSLMVDHFNGWDVYSKARDLGGMQPDEMFQRPDIRKALKASNSLACGSVISALDPKTVKKLDFDAEFGTNAPAVISESLKALGRKQNADAGQNGNINRKQQLDPELFTLLKKKVKPKDWNDPRQGLGPRVCQVLWGNGHYDQACEMIDYGVDTTLSTRAVGNADKEIGRADGYYSGFVQPLQHIVAKYLPKVAELPKNETKQPDHLTEEGRKIRGAKQVFEKLASYENANENKKDWKPENICSQTNYEDVKNSEMIVGFNDNPGTIWGFEDIRLPYVQAAHEAQGDRKKAQPLRMMELWEIVGPAINEGFFNRMHKNPDVEIPKEIGKAMKVLKIEKFPGVQPDEWDDLLKNFEKDANAFCREYIAQLPKVTFTHGDVGSMPSELNGIEVSKHRGGMGCKAGFWWAKKAGQSVYYCLDGIKMEDVVNYKTMKTAAVQTFIDTGGGKVDPDQGKGHAETITIVEVREILKNWDSLKDTVVWVNKGKVMKDQEGDNFAKKWAKEMKDSDSKAGRLPAPPRATYAKNLDGIDPGLQALLDQKSKKTEDKTDDRTNKKVDWTKEADMDARDIVKKSGYLLKLAMTRRDLALRYIVDRCEVLVEYQLLSPGLSAAAANLESIYNGGKGSVSKARKAVQAEIDQCHASLQGPLTASLIRKTEYA